MESSPFSIKVFFRSKPPLTITEGDVQVSYFSGGSGGQNVNKHMNGVRLRYITPKGDVIMSSCMDQREKDQNFKDAWRTLEQRIRAYFYEKPKRKATKATRSSKEKRIQGKKRRSTIKRARQSKGFDL